MKIYCSLDPGDLTADSIKKFRIRRPLISYLHFVTNEKYVSITKRDKLFEIIKANKADYFLDSGAFTAYSQKSLTPTGHNKIFPKQTRILVRNYISFIEEYGHYFDVIAGLDVIGDAQASFANYKDIARNTKYPILPTYHLGEPIEYFDKYCALVDYFAIGGLVPIRDRLAKVQIIRRLIERKNRFDPNIKLHLFGYTDILMLRKIGHLVHSVDSTSWKSSTRVADFLTPSGQRVSYLDDLKMKNVMGHAPMYAICGLNVSVLQEIEDEINGLNTTKEEQIINVNN